ncbi:MAG: hypothetical protein QF781_00315 [Phycisphaerales bacterium]|jgi:hypothetical protein|nr:hypothetical protein [Planctomycetaceae bacterium]MDP6157266.1 hypothetical protein [Phycisphaerales bacterium]MDP6310584.1 hypothetical protein [Phycisphaerales bacterium]MDP7086867.1 hypothetical protein [Phycisphaerales bacterium]MDP7188772.1 hypothetical protein [Phycisphaerales bacterium]|tara:strand:+ start:2389 stop:3720 length:1332 start_codon:yes stop_codon:yes gene_type:complete
MKKRRGIVLAAVTIVTAASLWTTVALLAIAGVETAGIDGGSEAIQEDAAVHSAVLVFATELFEQRDDMRVGKAPNLDDQIVLWESGRHATVARLLPVEGERVLVAEAGRLDLNLASVEQLDQVLGRSEAVVSKRNAHRIDDVRDVLMQFDQGPIEATDSGGICQRLTVHAHEPNVQQSGDLRINLDVPWSEELAERIRSRFNDVITEALEKILAENPVESDADLMRLILSFDMPPKDWADAIDAFSMEPVRYRRGRIDINAASAEVLASLPGVTADQAAAIVQRRDGLDDELLATPAWPFIEDILPTEIAVDFLDRATVGSWTWRLRLACGEVPGDALDTVLQDARVVDVIVDVAGEQPRIAMMRDITMRRQACAWPGRGDQLPVAEGEIVEPAPGEVLNAEPAPGEAVGVESPEPADPNIASEADTVESIEPDDQRLGRWRP